MVTYLRKTDPGVAAEEQHGVSHGGSSSQALAGDGQHGGKERQVVHPPFLVKGRLEQDSWLQHRRAQTSTSNIFKPNPRKMIDSSFSWAEARGLTRKNEVHGEDEAKLILDDGFSVVMEEGERQERGTTLNVEVTWLDVDTATHVRPLLILNANSKDPDGAMWGNDDGLLDVNATSEVVLKHGADASEHLHAQAAANNSGSFKLLG